MILSERNRRAEIFWTYADDFFLPGGESDELEFCQPRNRSCQSARGTLFYVEPDVRQVISVADER
jgi:hypothetical protein